MTIIERIDNAATRAQLAAMGTPARCRPTPQGRATPPRLVTRARPRGALPTVEYAIRHHRCHAGFAKDAHCDSRRTRYAQPSNPSSRKRSTPDETQRRGNMSPSNTPWASPLSPLSLGISLRCDLPGRPELPPCARPSARVDRLHQEAARRTRLRPIRAVSYTVERGNGRGVTGSAYPAVPPDRSGARALHGHDHRRGDLP